MIRRKKWLKEKKIFLSVKFMKRLGILFIFCLLGSGLILNNGCKTDQEKPASKVKKETELSAQKIQPNGQNKNWHVTIDSAKRGKDPVSKKGCFLLELTIEYLGPDGDVQAPTAALKKVSGALVKDFGIIAPREVDFLVLDWFSSGVYSLPEKRTLKTLKTGDKFSLTYTFPDPLGEKPHSLIFDDVSPIPFNIEP